MIDGHTTDFRGLSQQINIHPRIETLEGTHTMDLNNDTNDQDDPLIDDSANLNRFQSLTSFNDVDNLDGTNNLDDLELDEDA